LLTVVGLLPIIFADNWIYPVIGRALMGIGSSAAILGTFKIIRMSFNERHFTRMLSLSVTIGLIGAIYGGGPVSYLCSIWGYKMVVQIFAVLGLVLATITYFLVPQTESSSSGTIISDIKLVFANKRVIALCCFAGLMVGPLEGFADVWGAAFLKQVYGLDQHIASYLPSMIFMGMCFGAPLLSIIAEKTGRYMATIILSGIFMLITFAALIAQILTVPTITVSFFITGICCAYQILAIYKASTYVPENVTGLTTAVANMIIMIFGYAFHSVIGFVINAHGNFIHGIAVIPAALAIGVIGFLIISSQEKNYRII
jgi:predicted MFS family arabinose efflux permease